MGVRSMLSTSRTAAKSPSVNWLSLFQEPAWRSGLDTARPSSGLLRRHRRFFAVAAFLLLATPLVFGILKPDSAASVLKEGRYPAPAPNPPDSLSDWLKLPKQIDAYLDDRFGLRERMIRLHKDLTHPVLLKVNSAILIGRSGRMFYQGNEMVRQSAGLVLRDAGVAQTARFIAEMRDALAKRGARLLVAIPPNSSTIYQDDLPIWAQDKGRKTEYDLLLEDLKGYGVKTVDLRPVLTALRGQGEEAYLLYDAHWTPRGALTGFNAIVEADGRPEWRLDPATALGPLGERKGGDAARILGVQDDVREKIPEFALPLQGTDEILSSGIMPDHIVATPRPGPTILVIGDSFTQSYFPLMLSQHGGRAIWIHHHECGFDWKLIDKFRPDEVWWAPTERFLLCDPGVVPIDFEAEGR
jgi:alginate O-acetyltransferase complex protein AlgJ